MTSPDGRVLQHPGRRQRGRGGQVLRLERGGDRATCSAPELGDVRAAGLRRDRATATSRGTTSCSAPAVDEEDAKCSGCRSRSSAPSSRRSKRELYEVRSKRVWPGRDEKILTAWNGLMIAAFAKAGAVFGDDEYVDAAAGAADFILGHLRDADGRLFRTGSGDGQPRSSTATSKTTPTSPTRS